MMKRVLRLDAIGSLLAALFFFAVVPGWAQGVDDRIKAVEGELAKLKAQQLEFKKEATAAADALPTFSYRPSDGMTITAGDQSWSFNISYRMNVHMSNHPGGRSHFIGCCDEEDELTEIGMGTTNAELTPRRNRMSFIFCWDNCFYEMQHSMDGERSARIAQARDSEIMFHFEQWNPWLPMFSIGVRRGAGDTHVARSSSSDARLEHDMILAFGDWGGSGSHAGAGLHWDGVDIGSGEYSLFVNWASSSQGAHFSQLDSDRKGIMAFFGAKPFTKTKSKWIEGLEIGVGFQGHAIDDFDGRDFELATLEDRSELTLFSLDDDIGSGWSYLISPGAKWRIGPYMVRGVFHDTRTEGRDDGNRGVRGRGWDISQQLFLWSPKGLLTGSSSTPHSVLVGFAFERTDIQCGLGCDNGENFDSLGIHRMTVLHREVGVWYFIRRALRVGAWWHIYKTTNTPDNVQVAVGCKKSFASATAGKSDSRSCSWYSWNLGLQYNW